MIIIILNNYSHREGIFVSQSSKNFVINNFKLSQIFFCFIAIKYSLLLRKKNCTSQIKLYI